MLDYLREMFVFDDWANREALRSVREMEHPPERAHKVMSHIVAAELLWMARLQREPQKTAVWPEFGLDECERWLRRAAAEPGNSTWQACVTPDLDNEIPYTNSKGEKYATPCATS